MLYCPWEGPKTGHPRPVRGRPRKQPPQDRGLRREARADSLFLPPYEHYNQEIADWATAMGLTLVDSAPRHPLECRLYGKGDKNFVYHEGHLSKASSARRNRIRTSLNGCIFLLRIGSGPSRADKFARPSASCSITWPARATGSCGWTPCWSRDDLCLTARRGPNREWQMAQEGGAGREDVEVRQCMSSLPW